MMPLLGILFALVVDVVIPAGLLGWMARLNHSRRQSGGSERKFWIWIGVYSVWMSFWAALALRAAYDYAGGPTFAAVFVTLPMSALSSIFNSNVIHYFFLPSQWASFGYVIVMPVFLTGIVLWALVLPVGIRRLAQHGSLRSATLPTDPAPST